MRAFVFALCCFAAVPVMAQDREQTLADIRQDLTVLFVEVQNLRRELSTTSGPSVNLSGTNIPGRVDQLEAELARLTAQTEELQNRVDRIVTDGTNRIGDLEFRLVELEGGDPQDTFSNCRSRWVTLSCDGTWLPKTISSSLLEQAQIAYALKRTIRVVVDNERGRNGYCLATRIDLR